MLGTGFIDDGLIKLVASSGLVSTVLTDSTSSFSIILYWFFSFYRCSIRGKMISFCEWGSICEEATLVSSVGRRWKKGSWPRTSRVYLHNSCPIMLVYNLIETTITLTDWRGSGNRSRQRSRFWSRALFLTIFSGFIQCDFNMFCNDGNRRWFQSMPCYEFLYQ